MKNIDALIDGYLKSKTNAWASSTSDSERHRLAAVAHALDGKPETLLKATQALKAYSRVTTWTRVVDFYEWCLENGHVSGSNVYRTYRKRNARMFKNAYTTKTPEISFDEARARIERLADESIRIRALDILSSGLRWSESEQSGDYVCGKGGKRRRVYRQVTGAERSLVNYQAFRRALASIGIKPHDLRKLAATELARRGLNEADLCKVMGWESFTTAKAYIAPVEEDRLGSLVRGLQGPGNDAPSKGDVDGKRSEDSAA